MLDLNTIDPATLTASLELDALIAGEKWMGWHLSDETHWSGPPAHRYNYKLWLRTDDGTTGYNTTSTNGFHPSTNAAHAGQARRKETYHEVTHGRWEVCVEIGGKTHTAGYAEVAYTETNGDKGKAEALATCRAIVDALQAAEAAGGEL